MAAANSKGITRHSVLISSVSPMLQNPMTDETLDELLGGKAARRAPQTDITVEQRAQQKLCLGPNGEFGIPETYIFAALVVAGREVQYEGKSKISTATSSKMPGFLSIMSPLQTASGDGFIPFVDQSIMWVPDKRRGVLAANGAAVAIVRPKFPSWALRFDLEVNEDLIGLDKVRQLVEVAGRSAGLGDFRPAKRGPFGRFTVTEFAVAQVALDQAA